MRNFTGAFIYIYISIGMYIHIIIYRIVCITIIIERSLEVKLSTIWTDGKGEVGRVREEKSRSEKIRERVRRKKMQVREKGRKVAIHCVFPMICGSGRSKSRLAKAAGAKPCGQMRDEKLHTVKTHKTHQGGSVFGSCDVQKVHTVLARSTSPSQMYKTHQGGSTFGSCDVQKVHAVAARSTCASQNVQSTPCSEHFWKLRCRKSTRCCCAKHISKSKVLKTDGFGALLDVQMWFCVACARDCAPCQK